MTAYTPSDIADLKAKALADDGFHCGSRVVLDLIEYFEDYIERQRDVQRIMMSEIKLSLPKRGLL